MSKISPLCLLLLICALGACSNPMSFRKSEGITWHTQYHITYEAADDLSDSIRIVLDSIDSALSFFNPESEVTRLNKSEGSTKVGEMVRDVYALSRRVWTMTDSMFDPTVSPAISAWGFGKNRSANPDTLALDSLKQFVGLEKTFLKGIYIHKQNPRTEFNFSAVAKGYGVDRIGGLLRRNGVTNYLVEIGGEIRAEGHSPSGKDWRIMIDSPESDSQPGEKPMVFVSFTNMGMASSGNYRNFHTDANGKKFGHTISPKTLRPIQTNILAVTVLAPTCAEADALATAAMALGHPRAEQLLDSLKLPALFILDQSDKPTALPNKYWKSE